MVRNHYDLVDVCVAGIDVTSVVNHQNYAKVMPIEDVAFVVTFLSINVSKVNFDWFNGFSLAIYYSVVTSKLNIVVNVRINLISKVAHVMNCIIIKLRRIITFYHYYNYPFRCIPCNVHALPFSKRDDQDSVVEKDTLSTLYYSLISERI